jgi:hypothetical protein
VWDLGSFVFYLAVDVNAGWLYVHVASYSVVLFPLFYCGYFGGEVLVSWWFSIALLRLVVMVETAYGRSVVM